MAKKFNGGVFRRYPYPYQRLRKRGFVVNSFELSVNIQWRQGGTVEAITDIRWRQGGRVSSDLEFEWSVAPSPNRIQWALEGRFGPVVYSFSYERRTKTNQFVDDITPAVLGCTIDLSNDRDVLRTARFTIDATAEDDNGNAIVIDTLSDRVAVFMDLLVDFTWTERIQLGLFALSQPKRQITPLIELWDVAASDLGIHLIEATTTGPYTVASGQNYITGTNGVKSILDTFGLAHLLPSTAKTLPVATTWPPGTPWLRVVNDLLGGLNMYSLWFDNKGVARSRERQELSGLTQDVTYSSDEFVMAPLNDEQDTTRFANQIVAVVQDPNRAVLYSVRTNADTNNPISTISLGRTITKTLSPANIADQTTLDSYATRELEEAAAVYKRAVITTPIDPRRQAHEVYRLEIDSVDGYEGENWWARSWSMECKVGGQMRHNIGKVHRLVAT